MYIYVVPFQGSDAESTESNLKYWPEYIKIVENHKTVLDPTGDGRHHEIRTTPILESQLNRFTVMRADRLKIVVQQHGAANAYSKKTCDSRKYHQTVGSWPCPVVPGSREKLLGSIAR